MELAAAIVAHEPRRLLEVSRFELEHRRRAVAVRLLPPRDERLPKQAADRFPSVQTQESAPLSEAEQLIGPRRPQPITET